MEESNGPVLEKNQPVEKKTEVSKEDVAEKAVEKKSESEHETGKKPVLTEKKEVEKPKEAKKEPKGKLMFLKV